MITQPHSGGALDARAYRELIGHFATGVTIITTAVDGRFHGMTANAVTSVSLDPLMLLVCVDLDAHCHSHLTAAGHFGVNILNADQQEVAETFARRAEPEVDQLRGVPFHIGDHGIPLLDRCLGQLECRVSERLPGGDHDIFLGEVLGGQLLDSTKPLLFYRGTYHRLANADE